MDKIQYLETVNGRIQHDKFVDFMFHAPRKGAEGAFVDPRYKALDGKTGRGEPFIKALYAGVADSLENETGEKAVYAVADVTYKQIAGYSLAVMRFCDPIEMNEAKYIIYAVRFPWKTRYFTVDRTWGGPYSMNEWKENGDFVTVDTGNKTGGNIHGMLKVLSKVLRG